MGGATGAEPSGNGAEPSVHLCLLGPLELAVGGQRVEIRAARERCLLAALTCEPDLTASDDRLMERLWGDEPPATAKATLQTYVSHLRRALRPAGIVRTGEGYALVGAELDTLVFHEAVESGLGATSSRRRRELLGEALELWRGTPFTELGDDPSVLALRRSWEERHLLALEAWFEARLDLGEHGEVVGALEVHVAAEPLRERSTALLMLALYRCGRQADALAACRRLRERLLDELGLDPSPAVTDMEERILRQDPALVLATPQEFTSGSDVATSGAVAAVPLPARLIASRADLPFAGRRPELALLVELLEEAEQGRVSPIAVVAGEAGIGKSRLARELAYVAAGRGGWVAWGRCLPDGGGELQPWVEVLEHLVRHRPELSEGWERLLAPLVPALSDTGHDPLLVLQTGTEQRFAVIEAVTDVCRRASVGQPLLVVLDDVQWADGASTAVLEYLADAAVPGLVVAMTVRSPEPTGRSAPADLVARLTRERKTEVVELGGLTDNELRVLWDGVTGSAAPPDAVAELRARTGGNPFFASEVIAADADDAERRRGEPTQDTETTDPTDVAAGATVPSRVQVVLDRRLDHLGRDDEQVLAAGAVWGEEFDLAACAACAGVTELAALDALERVVAVGLLDEVADGAFAFPHGLVRAAVLDRTGASRRRLHEERVAEVRRQRDTSDSGALGRRIAQRSLAERTTPLDGDQPSSDHDLVRSRMLLDGLNASSGNTATDAGATAIDDLPIRSSGAGYAVLRSAVSLLDAGRVRSARQRALECVAVGRRLEDSLLTARAARVAAGAEGLGPGFGGAPSPEVSAAVADALDRLGTEDGQLGLRATLLAMSAQLRSIDGGDVADAEALFAGAEAAARRSGDEASLATVLLSFRRARYGPADLEVRLGLATAALEAAENAGVGSLTVLALGALASDHASGGDADGVAKVVQRLQDFAEQYQLADRLVGLVVASSALHVGALDRVAALLDRLTVEAPPGAAGDLAPDDPVAGLLLVLAIEQNRLAESRGSIAAAVQRWPDSLLWRAAEIEAVRSAGDEVGARGLLDDLVASDVPARLSIGRLGGLCLLASAVHGLGHPAAAMVADQLAPYEDRYPLVGVIGPLDPVSRYRALCAITTGEWGLAHELLDAAAASVGEGTPTDRRLAADRAVLFAAQSGSAAADQR